ncbi:MAG: T9SS type B sorting domain-containing protein [Flavobacterium sp.]
MRKFLHLFFLITGYCVFGQQQVQSIGFIENRGQIVDQKGKPNPNVKYLLNTNGLNVQLRKNGFSYDVYEPYGKSKKLPGSKALFHRIDIDFIGCNPNAVLIPEGKSADYDNYYTVASRPDGVLNVHKFQKITYENIYPNIDVVFFIPEDRSKPVEYNFIIRPNASIGDIQMKFSGAKTELADNKIKMNISFGAMEETLPMSWTEHGGVKNEIAIRYKKIRKDVYGFESSEITSGKILIIDPTPTRLWGTYYNGYGGDYSTDISNDSNNNVIIAGHTFSTTNMATIGSYDPFPHAYYTGNGFIAKFDTNGVRQWGIYYSTVPDVMKCDSAGNIYFAGEVWRDEAPNVVTPGSHQPMYSDYDDAYLVKLDPQGTRIWGTYYGGRLTENARDICFDSSDNVYLAGNTSSYENIATPGTHQPVYTPGGIFYDAFLVKFTPQGARLWGTYYGGESYEDVASISISPDGFVYLTGWTTSTSGIGTPGSFQPNISGNRSGMIAKFSSTGQLAWGSYFSANNYCVINSSRIKDNYLYLTGIITSNSILTTANTLNTFNPTFINLPNQFGYSSFVAKFDTTTQTLSWGTYFGEIIQDLEISTNNKVFIEGVTYQTSGIATPGAYSTSPQYSDAYVIKLNENGQREWGTYYGGNATDGTNGAANVNNKLSLDTQNNLYLIGNTNSSAGLTTPGSHQPNHTLNPSGGLYNIYVAKLQDCLSAPVVNGNANICIGNTINLTASGGTNYSWTGPNGFSSNQQNPSINNAGTVNSGIYSCNITGTGGCDGTVSTNIVVGDVTKPVPNLAILPAITGDCNTIVTTIPTATDNCAGSITATTSSPLSYALPGNYTITWTYTDGNGNTETQTQSIVISAVSIPSITGSNQFCIQQNATLANIVITGSNIKWYDALTGGNLLPNTTLLQNGITYYASQTINGCESQRIAVPVSIQNTPPPTGSSQSLCATQNPTLSNIAANGTAIKWYATVTSMAELPSTTLLSDNTTYYASQTINGCESTTRLPITISLINSLNAINYSAYICDDGNNDSENVVLPDFDSFLISSIAGNTFTYFGSLNGAENQITSEQFQTNHSITIGLNTVFVRIDSSNGCHQVVQLQLTLVHVPIIPIADEVPLCENRSISVNAGTGFDSYNWSTGTTSSSITITQAGTYSVTVTQNHGSATCSSVKNFQVVVSNAPVIESIAIADWTDDQNSITVHLAASSLGNYEYSIDSIHFQDSNAFYGLGSGNYTVTVRDKKGCGIAVKMVYLLNYPKFFTPNGDGYNDNWYIKFSQSEPDFEVRIFDRYGKLLKIMNGLGFWDGTYNGKPMPADDYWFFVTREDGRIHKGHFSLLR